MQKNGNGKRYDYCNLMADDGFHSFIHSFY